MSLEDHHKVMGMANRKVQMAVALMKRAENAGIPTKFMKIGPSDFKSHLCPNFHKDKIDRLVEKIYTDPKFIKRYDAIAIDGANYMVRKKAMFAILYRVITFDNFGMYEDFGDITETFKRFQPEETAGLIDAMKSTDILALSEFSRTIFQKAPYSIPRNWDAILQKRCDKSKVTIISFSNTLPSNPAHTIDDDTCGLFMPLVYNHDVEKELKVLRIRVKK